MRHTHSALPAFSSLDRQGGRRNSVHDRPKGRSTGAPSEGSCERYVGRGISVAKVAGGCLPSRAPRSNDDFSALEDTDGRICAKELKRENETLRTANAHYVKLLRSCEVSVNIGSNDTEGVKVSLDLLCRQNQLLKAQTCQLERQVVWLEDELMGKTELMFEAQACLDDVLDCAEQFSSDKELLPGRFMSLEAALQRHVKRLKSAVAAFNRMDISSESLADVQFVPVGGNAHLEASCNPQSTGVTMSGIAKGVLSPSLLQHPSAVHIASDTLSLVCNHLGSLALKLRASVLPAIRVLDDSAAATLHALLAETAAACAGGASQLAELTVLLPGRAALFGLAAKDKLMQKAKLSSEGAASWDSFTGIIRMLDDSARVPTNNMPNGKEIWPDPALSTNASIQPLRNQLLEMEICHLAASQVHQTRQLSAIEDLLIRDAQSWGREVSELSSQVQCSLRAILDASDLLLANPSERNLRKLVTLLSLHLPTLHKGPQLLNDPPSLSGVNELRSKFQSLGVRLQETWATACMQQDERRAKFIEELAPRLGTVMQSVPAEFQVYQQVLEDVMANLSTNQKRLSLHEVESASTMPTSLQTTEMTQGQGSVAGDKRCAKNASRRLKVDLPPFGMTKESHADASKGQGSSRGSTKRPPFNLDLK